MPIAVGINGAALGGGFEIALACHHRIALDDKRVQIGLPEAMLGLMPGAGGIVRMVRLLGMQDALTLISQGKRLNARQAIEKGLVHELAANEDEMATKAKAWIKANPDAQQPWERPGYSIPGGAPRRTGDASINVFWPGKCHGANQRQYAPRSRSLWPPSLILPESTMTPHTR